jgi:putative holliday junction resolvase
MTASPKNLIALDVGEKRIGVASANTAVRIAIPTTTLAVDGTEVKEIAEIAIREAADAIIVGYPRNQAGEPTAQTAYVEAFAKQLEDIAPIKFQDESLTSVTAEQRLKSRGKPYTKEDIDSEAAVIILQDYLELHYGA